MSYHDLSECTLSLSERIQEALRLIKIIKDYTDKLTDKEREFVSKMCTTQQISVKQLFWLRDIKDRVL
jgi:hypothetical protein